MEEQLKRFFSDKFSIITRHKNIYYCDIFYLAIFKLPLEPFWEEPIISICFTPVQLILRYNHTSKCYFPILRLNARLKEVNQGSTGKIKEQTKAVLARLTLLCPILPIRHVEAGN